MTKEKQLDSDGDVSAAKDSGQTLRQRAEEAFPEKTAHLPVDLTTLSPEEARQMLHELRVHQIELEIQNEELRRTQAALVSARAKYFDLYDLAPVGYFTLSEQGLILEINLTAAALLSVARSALFKRRLTEFILPEDEDIYYRHRKLLFETGSPQVCEIRMMRADASPFWVRIDAAAAEDTDGAPSCRATMINITDRKQAQEALRESETKLQAIFDTVGTGILIIDSDTQIIIEANKTAIEMTGLPKERIIGQICHSLVCPAQEGKCPVKDLNQSVDHSERKLLCADGRQKDILKTVYPLTIRGRDYYVESFTDISDRLQAESRLRESERRFNLAINGAGAGLWDWDMLLDRVVYSAQWKKMLGYEEHEVEDAFSGWRNLWHPDDRADIEKAAQDYLEGITAQYEIIHRLRHKDGSWRWILTRGDIMKDAQGKPCRWTGTNVDITAQKRLEERLKSSEENFRTFFNTMDDLIIVGNPDGKIIYANPAVTSKLGYSLAELENMHVLDVHPADRRREAEAIFAAMFRGERDSCPLPLGRKDGALVPVETRVWFGKWSGEDCIFGICKDLSREQEALQKFNRLFQNNPAPMAVSSFAERRFTEVNDAFLKTFGYSRAEVIDRTSRELGLFLVPEKLREIEEDLQTHGKVAGCEVKARCKDGTIIDGLFSGEIIDNQGTKHFLSVMVDQTERKHYEEKLAHFAIHDRLTGLLNRLGLEGILDRAIAKAKRGAASSILYMDLDNFKDVNDSVGHSAGDEVLVTLVGLLRDALRAEDIVFRLGGDEFAVLLDGMTSREALPAAKRLCAAVEAHRFELEGRVFPLTLSIGVKELDGTLTMGELISQADIAMYRAKAQGKNRVAVA